MKKILIVDDDIDILFAIQLILIHHHFQVKTVHEWSVISETIKSFTPDLMILDIDLNGADGGEICNELKSAKEKLELPVILCSVYPMPDKYVKECKAEGFLSKPFKTGELLNIINKHIS